MAVQDITAYAHLSDDDVRDIGRRLSAIEKAHRESLGGKDADYIKSLIRTQRALDLIARIATATSSTVAVPAGMMLGLAKILENLEIGHNVMHGQWDWMNDPEIHSSTWEWDNTGPSSGWKHSHNVVHHTYTNIIGMDNDVGYGVLRVTRDRKWTPQALMQPLINVVLASLSNSPSASTMSNWAGISQAAKAGRRPNPVCSTPSQKPDDSSARTTLASRRSPQPRVISSRAQRTAGSSPVSQARSVEPVLR